MEREVWLACAGPFALLPSINEQVYYFPRGHAHQCGGSFPHPPADDAIPCTVSSLELEFHPLSDDPYALITLQPDPQPGPAAAQPGVAAPAPTAARYFLKDLGSNNADRAPFSVPKRCAERLFALGNKPGEEDLEMVDVHGRAYEIKHLNNDTGSHRLSGGWNEFSKHKRLQSRIGKDAVVVMRRANGGFVLGTRRGGPSDARAADMVQNVAQAAEREPGHPFTVSYYPRQGWAFVVPRNLVDDAPLIQWRPGMHVGMAIPEDPHELVESRRYAKTPAFYYGVVENIRENARWCKLQVEWGKPSPPDREVNVWQVEQYVKRQRTTAAPPSSSTATPSSSTAPAE